MNETNSTLNPETGETHQMGASRSTWRMALWVGWTAMVLVTWFGMAWVMVGATTEKPRPIAPAVRDFMRQKLAHSQAVLEGLALEDFQMVTTHAKKLAALSQDVSWKVMDSPEYREHSEMFRRNVESLIRSANLGNVDGATLAYMKVTMSCVECHKFVRGKKMASL